MSTFITIDELGIRKDTYNGKDIFYLYPALLSIYSSTREELNEITSELLVSNIFNFSNTGTYAGYDNNLDMHFTFDDGQQEYNWFIQLIRFITFKNAHKKDIKLRIRKSTLEDYGITDYSDTLTDISSESINGLIDSYIFFIRRLLTKTAHLDILDCKATGNTKHNNLLVRDKLYITGRIKEKTNGK